MKSATMSIGSTMPTEGLAPKILAINTTLRVAVPARPDFDNPMQRAPKRASSRIQPSAGRRVCSWIQFIIRRSESQSDSAGERLHLQVAVFHLAAIAFEPDGSGLRNLQSVLEDFAIAFGMGDAALHGDDEFIPILGLIFF